MSILRKILLITIAFSFIFSFGCRTIGGFSRDIGHGAMIAGDILAPIEKDLEQDRIERAARLVSESR